MATLDFGEHTIELSIAYFGPLQAGCGTNVRHLHRTAPARERSELRRVGGKERRERMWHFAYEPPDPPRIQGFEVRVRTCSIPSGPDIHLDRGAMLRGVDGIVFVADARGSRADANLAALLDLDQLLAKHGLDVGAVPMVFQVNQADAQNARPYARVVEDLNPFGFPVFEATARQGHGVLDTHEAILASVLARVRDAVDGGQASVTLTALSQADIERAEAAVVSHAATLPQARREMPPSLGLPASAEIPVRLAELRGTSPVQHVRTEVRGDRLRVAATFRRVDGTHRKLAFLIEPAPDDEEATASRPAGAADIAAPPRSRIVTADDGTGDLPRLAYGIAGVTGGLIAGWLFGYIWFG